MNLFVNAQQAHEFTSQLYIDDAVNDVVLANPPYNTRGNRTVRNVNDGIFSSKTLLDVQREASGTGYVARFNLGLQGV